MSTRSILQLGNPLLRQRCANVRAYGTPELQSLSSDLRETLLAFRMSNGFGRGIAAPQIGALQRVIFISTGDLDCALLNPVVTRRSRKMMTLWDDCFSFPTLVVRVQRHLSIDVDYRDVEGKKHHVRAEGGLSELLQHEIDHLDGVLAIDRALDSRHIVYKEEYQKWVDKNKKNIL